MKRRLAIAAILLGTGVPALAGSQMSAGEFLTRAEPLMKKNKVALLFSGEARKLMRAIGEAAQNTRERLDADRAAGRRVTTCLPPKGEGSVNSAELLDYLRALPPARRTQSFKSAFAGLMAEKYPCKS